MTSLLAAMGGLEAIIAIAGASLGCRVACCGRSANAQIVDMHRYEGGVKEGRF